MKFRIYLITIVLIIVAVFLKGCEDAWKDSNQARELVLTQEQKVLVQNSNRFTFSFFNQSNMALKPDQNGFMSPLGIQTVLALVGQGAQGETKERMMTTLGLNAIPDAEIQGYFSALMKQLPRLDPQVEVGFANSVWHTLGTKVDPHFLDVVGGFGAKLREVDFQSPEATQHVNDWVHNQTRGKIEKIVDEIPVDWAFLLMNAIYFKGDWQKSFDVKNTQSLPFFIGEGQEVMAQFINREDEWRLWNGASFEGVEIPYGQGKYRMVLLKPVSGKDLSSVRSELENLQEVGEQMPFVSSEHAKRRVWIPKFRFSYEKTLNNDLQDLGMGIAFSEQADFKKILINQSMRIDEVKHKSFVELDEKGTEAAAVTSVGMVVTSMPMPAAELKFDKPFMFFIQEAKSGLVLFVGQINNPLSDHTQMD